MKMIKLLIGCSLLVLPASATSVIASGGTTSAKFFTSTNIGLTATNSTFTVGTYDGSIFTAFGLGDASPISISTVGVLANTWANGVTDNNNTTAAPFNGLQVWFRVTTTAGGGGTAYFSSGQLFPNANAGVSDSVTVVSNNLTQLGAGSSAGSRAFSSTDGRILIGVVPEPSVALLGALGIFGLVRRRR